MEDSLQSWFKREILIHEESLLSYLLRTWPKRDEVPDLRQDTYIRVFDAAAKVRPLQPKSFLFTTARNLMSDRIRRERIVSIEAVGDIDVLNVLIDEISPERRVSARQELKRLAQALDLLPPKCREVIWLRKVQEISQKEVARRLGINEKTVEKHISKGGRLLAEHLLAGDLTDASPHRAAAQLEKDSGHGKHQKD